MFIVAELSDDLYTRLFDNGIELSKEDQNELEKAVRHGSTIQNDTGRYFIVSENKMRKQSVHLDMPHQQWISEVGLYDATEIILHTDKKGEPK